MDTKIEQLTAGEHEWIAQQIAIAQEFVQRTLNKDTEELPSPEDLDQAFNSWLHSLSQEPSDANSVVNCVGVAFGQHLVDTTPLEWVIASDEYGAELALYGLPGQGDVQYLKELQVLESPESYPSLAERAYARTLVRPWRYPSSGRD